MPETFEELAPRLETPCTVEVFRRAIPGNVRIWYWVAEGRPDPSVKYPDPVDIIAWDQPYFVYVRIVLDDPVRRHFCGYLCVDIDIDTCGPAPDLQFDEKDVRIDPCSTGEYIVTFELPPDTFKPDEGHPARCGRLYRICVTVGSKDACDPPGPGLIWGKCDAVEIAVHPPVPSP